MQIPLFDHGHDSVAFVSILLTRSNVHASEPARTIQTFYEDGNAKSQPARASAEIPALMPTYIVLCDCVREYPKLLRHHCVRGMCVHIYLPASIA